MYGVLQRQEQWSGDDHQERLMLSFDKMFGRERDGALGVLFDYWLASRSQGKILPTIGNFCPKEFVPPYLARAVSSVDVTFESPLNYVFRDHPHFTPGFNDLSNCRLGDQPSEMNALACASEYICCIRSQQPMYHEINQKIGNASRCYWRLTLPVADSCGRVVKLYYAIRMFG